MIAGMSVFPQEDGGICAGAGLGVGTTCILTGVDSGSPVDSTSEAWLLHPVKMTAVIATSKEISNGLCPVGSIMLTGLLLQ